MMSIIGERAYFVVSDHRKSCSWHAPLRCEVVARCFRLPAALSATRAQASDLKLHSGTKHVCSGSYTRAYSIANA
jgi:hypothetical protein